jgi:hypothetical protein
VGKLTQGGLAAVIIRWASGLRFPWLFALTAALFTLNVFIPDVLPLADEILLGLGALLLARLKKKKPDKSAAEPGIKLTAPPKPPPG